MRLIHGLTREKRRAVGLAALAGVVAVTAGSFARASGAGGTTADRPSATDAYPMAEADQPWVYQRFLVSSQADIDRLNRMGVDLGESLDKNSDGTIWVNAVVTDAQRDYLATLGFRPGSIIQTKPTRRRRRPRWPIPREWSSRRCASRRPAARQGREARRHAAAETIKVTRADYYQSSSGTWLSVEAKSSAAQGNAAVPPGTPGCPATAATAAVSSAGRRPARAGATPTAARPH